MSRFLIVIMLACPSLLTAQSNSQNYILETVFLDTLGANRVSNLAYFDGIGNKVESVTTSTGSGNPVYAVNTYDSKGRVEKEYLPVPIGSDLSFKDVNQFLSSSAAYYNGDETAFRSNHYDTEDRIIAEDIPGLVWHAAGKRESHGYGTNKYDDYILNYEAPLNTNSLVKPENASFRYYPAGSLSKEVHTDADGKSITLFKDLQGNIILERREIGDTYFVYNVLGQLRYVLSPEYQQSADTNMFAYEYRYDTRGNLVKKILPGCEYSQYWYDKERRLVFSQDAQLRAKGLYRFMLYDTKGRLAIQGLCGSCQLNVDNVDLHVSFPVGISGTGSFMGTGYVISVQGYIDTGTSTIEQVNYYDTYRFLSGNYSDEYAKMSATAASNGVGRLTGTVAATSNGQRVFRVNYYDVKGNVTRMLEKGLDDHTTHTVNGYTFTSQLDSTFTTVNVGYGEPLRVRNSYAYNMHNDMLESHSVSVSHGNSFHTNTVSYEYDDLNRLARIVRPSAVGAVAYSYDLHGWLTGIKSNSFRETLRYADGPGDPCYNGNISSIQWENASYGHQRNYSFKYDKLNRLTRAVYGEDMQASDTGHASETVNKEEKSPLTEKQQVFSQLRSKLGRIVVPFQEEKAVSFFDIKTADSQEVKRSTEIVLLPEYAESLVPFRDNTARYDEYAYYDLNGNITRMQRYGWMQDETFGLIDDLHVSLNGNQLSSVTDEAVKVVYEGSADFSNAEDSRSEYTYNGCGALTSDTGRGIAMIEYDNSNNPLRIQFTNGNVTRYVYTSDGQKLRTVYYTAMPNITVPIGETRELDPAEILCTDSVDYMLGGSLILRNGRIDKYLFTGGYCQAEETFCCLGRPMLFTSDFDEQTGEFVYRDPTKEEWDAYMELYERWGLASEAIRNSDDFHFYYYNKDHLGNIREVVDITGTVMQETNYYPFGMPYYDSRSAINPEFQPFKYNGKEFDMMHGLNTLDYGARQYNPVLPMWDRVDPLAENNYEVSPYAYCDNDPVNKIDPDGNWGWDVNGNLHSEERDNEYTLSKFLNTSLYNSSLLLSTYRIIHKDNNEYLKSGVILNKDNLCIIEYDHTAPVVHNTKEAVYHYYYGHGKAADVGDESTAELLSSPEFKRNHNAVTTKGREKESFDVDMTNKTFHIGDTNVDYYVSNGKRSSSVTYTLFVNDGFKDPLDIGIEAGGTPYDYKIRRVTYFFKPVYNKKRR